MTPRTEHPPNPRAIAAWVAGSLFAMGAIILYREPTLFWWLLAWCGAAVVAASLWVALRFGAENIDLRADVEKLERECDAHAAENARLTRTTDAPPIVDPGPPTLAERPDLRIVQPTPGCGNCRRCLADVPASPGSWLTVPMTRMIVCSSCGNKRCPHASDHDLACTASNEPGQPGSVYGGIPAQRTAEWDRIKRAVEDEA